MAVVVLACGHCGFPPSLASVSFGPGVELRWDRSLCDHGPKTLFPGGGTSTSVILLGGPDPESQIRLADAALGAGVHPLRLRVLESGRLFRDPTAAIVPHVRAAVSRLAQTPRLDGAPLRETSRFRGHVPRRFFLNPLHRYSEVVPQVDAGRCRPGCDLCVRACPTSAFTAGSPPRLDPTKCVSCAACLPACPRGALGLAGGDFPIVEREVETLADGPGLSLLVGCADSMRRLPDGVLDSTRWRVLELPSLGSLRPMEILRLLAKGFSQIVSVQAGDCCARGLHGFAVAGAFLNGIGRPGLISTWDLDVTRVPPAGRSGVPTPPLAATLPETAAEVISSGCFALPGRGAALVGVAADRCTMCRLCAERCPSGALRIEETADGSARLAFDHASCDGCGLCRDVCPEHAVTVRLGVDTEAAGRLEILKEDAWVLCAACGNRVAPKEMVARIASRMSLPMSLDLCPDCKPRRAFELLRR